MIPPQCQSEISARIAQVGARMRGHDHDLYAHSVLVGRLSFNFAVHLGFSLHDQRLVGVAALLHDAGKLHIDRSVLHKPTDLNEQEWSIMRSHPSLGAAILHNEGFHDPVVLDVAQNHHERLDGTGYPSGLSGKQLSDAVRIITLCDVFAAMTETRRYGTPYIWRDALERMAMQYTRLDLHFLRHFAAMIETQYDDSGQLWMVAGCLHAGGERHTAIR